MTALAQPHVLGILLATQLVIAGVMLGLSVREILRSPAKEAQSAADGYTLVVSLCSGVIAIFGVWGLAELAQSLGLGVDLGGHNAYGVFVIAFFGFIVTGTFLVLIGRAYLLGLPNRTRRDR